MCRVFHLGGNLPYLEQAISSAPALGDSWLADLSDITIQLKEINEQPEVARDSLVGRLERSKGSVSLPDLRLDAAGANAISKIYLVACGPSWHAAPVGKFSTESQSPIPVTLAYGR